jgi:hypothetical protein
MRRFLGILVGATILSMPLTVSAHHHLKHEFFVYDADTHAHVLGALVEVCYDGDCEPPLTTIAPHGSAMFRLPGEYPEVWVVVTADGYDSWEGWVPLSFRPHVGGRGIWIGLNALADQTR